MAGRLADIEEVVQQALAAGLVGPEKRRLLLHGLPMGFVYSLPTVSRPIDQLLKKDDLPVILQADSRADHGVFSDVWSEVKNAGAKKISLSTKND